MPRRRHPSRRGVLAAGAGSAVAGVTAGMPVWARSQGEAEEPMADHALTLFLCGDVMTGRGIDQILPNPVDPRLYEAYVTDARDYVRLAERANGPVPRGDDFAYPWGDALAELEAVAPDARIVNLETAVTTHGKPAPKGINYRMNPANLPVLAAAGIDCCVLANNHVLDWGEAGLIETLESLEAAGIAVCGAGRSAAEAAAPAVLDTAAGRRVQVYAFADESSGVPRDWAAGDGRAGVNLLPELSVEAARAAAAPMRAARERGDLVIASIHWGGNWGYRIPEAQRRFAHALIDAGAADAIHGHSAHHAKGIEVYQGRPILYGCGDFLNDYEGIGGHDAYRPELALMYFPRFAADGALTELIMTPMRIERMRLDRASAEEARELAGILSREGKPLGTAVAVREDGRLHLK